jgi:hypothetical protein
MDVKAGCYYRRKDGPIVKVLHGNVTPFRMENQRSVVYRYRDGEWPTLSEYMSYGLFVELHEGPLAWDTALKEFK